jgi:hypothetical protein
MPDTLNPYDDFDEAPTPAPGEPNAPQTEVVQGRPMSTVGALPQPTEEDQAAAARGARESAGRTPRQRAQPQPSAPSAKPAAEGASPYDQFDGAPNDDGVALMERLRLNRQDAFYRGTLAGSTGLAALAHIYRTPDPPDLSPERKAVNKEKRDEYLKIVADLAAHDQMEPWGTTLEAGVALGGQFSGMVFSPESWVGWAAKGATVAARAVRTGVQQGAIQAATDPAVQGLNISAGVEKDFDFLRPFIAGAAGFGIGVGGHLAGEGVAKIVGQAQLRKTLYDLGKEDGSFSAPQHAAWALDPNNGITMPEIARTDLPEMDVVRPQMPEAEAPPVRAEDTPIAGNQDKPSETGVSPSLTSEVAPPAKPDYGFDDVVAEQKERFGPEAPPEQVADAAFREEAGAVETAMDENGIAPEKRAEFQKLYKRQPGESVEDAIFRTLDEWIDIETRAQQAIETEDPVLRQELEQAESPASRETPPEFWTPKPEVLAEAVRLSKGWTARPEGKRPKSLVAFVRDNGGLLKDSPEASDLLAQDIGRQPGLLRTKEGGGRGADDMAEIVRDAGYDIGPDLDTGNGVNDRRFIEMLKEDASNRKKHYPADGSDNGYFDTQRYNDETEKHLRNRLGINPKGMDPKQIAWILEGGYERAGGRVSEEGGGVSGGRAAESRQGDRIAGPGEEPAVRGEPVGERPAAGESLAPTDRGEKLGPPAETLGGKPLTIEEQRAKFKELNERMKVEDDRAQVILDEALAQTPIRLELVKGDRTKLISGNTTEGVPYRITDFDAEGPSGHREYKGIETGPYSLKAELKDALRDGYTIKERPLATERTAQGEQTVMPGAERESPETVAARQRARDKEEAEARMRGRKGSGVGQESADDLALFGGERQKDLLGRAIPENDVQGLAQRRKGGTMEGEPERVPVERGEPASPEQDVAIRSLQQQSMDLAKALDFPLRQGRVESRGMAGTFNPRSGVVRVREVPDFDIVSHEAGHAIESKVGPDLTALTQASAGELRLLDYDQDPRTGQRVNEGFAEYVRLMMTNPAYARARAPGFDTQFRQFMQAREPEMLAKIDSAAAAYKAYLDAPSVDAVGSVRRSVDDDPKGVAKVIEHVRADGLPTVIKSVMQKSYDAILDDKAPIARAIRELGIAIRDRTGRPIDLKAADNPEVLMRLLARARQAAVRDLMDGVRGHHMVDPEGPALADAITEALGKPSVWGKWDEAGKADFDSYLIARRAEYLWRKFDAGEIPNPPVAFSRADAQMAMADFEKAMPNFRNASGMVHEYTRQLLKKSFDGGLIDADLYAKLAAEEFYVPFMRDMSDKPGAGTGMGQSAEGPGTTQIIKRLRGSSRDIKSPLESIMAQTFMVNRTLRHNDVIKAFVDLAKQAGPEGGKYVEVIPAHEARKYVADLEQAVQNRAKEIGMDPDEAKNIIAALGDPEGGPIQGSYFKMEQAAAHGEPIVFYREGGQLKAARFMSKEEGHGLYEILTAAPEPVTDLWLQVMTGTAGIMRAGIVTNPTFALANYIRDQFAAAIIRSDYVPIISGIKGIDAEFRQGESAVLYGYAGGVSGGASTGPVDRAFENEVNALAKKGYLVNRVTSFKGLLELASFTEAGTRNSIFDTVYQASKRKGLSDYEAMVEAAYQAQDLLDFSRHGSKTQAIRNLLPFLNAYAQGMDKTRRTLIEPILNRMREGNVFEKDTAEFNNALAAWMKAGAVGAAIGAAIAAIFSDNEAYLDASPYFKGTHLVIPWGNKIIVMPKPFEWGMGVTAGEFAYLALKKKDPTAAAKFFEAVMHTIVPPDPITGIPGIKTAFGVATNKSLMGWGWLTGESREIVPGEIQKLPSPQQYSDRTSELSKQIGAATGMSPMKIEYAIGDLFGLWGRDVMALSQGVSENSPAASMDDAIFFRRFVKDPTRSSNVVTKFWEYMGRTTGRFNQDVDGYNKLVKEIITRGASMAPANDFLAKLPAAERAFVTLKSGANDSGKPAFTPDERRLHPLQNAYDAVEMLNGLRKEISTNAQMTYGGREKVVLNPQERRLLLENVRELSQLSMRNALVILGEPGYANRPVLDPNDTMAKIRAISPVIADEIATRYATAKVYSTDAVRKAWPQLRDRLVRNGTEADVKELSYDAKAAGYQFEGTKAPRPGIPRRPIAGQPLTTP